MGPRNCGNQGFPKSQVCSAKIPYQIEKLGFPDQAARRLSTVSITAKDAMIGINAQPLQADPIGARCSRQLDK
jgi:hypothetical protein